MLRHHRDVWDPIRVTHLGQRSYDRTTKAGHMTAFDQIIIALPRPCETGAVHIWVPAFAGTAGCTWFHPGRVGQTGQCRTRNDRAFLVIASDAPDGHATSGNDYLYKMIFEVMIS